MEVWLAARTRRGSRCAECQAVFTVDRGDGKKLVRLPMPGGAGMSFYVLCNSCGVKYQGAGEVAVPNVWRDRRIAMAMNPYAPAPKWVN
jgi:hypothetical protein